MPAQPLSAPSAARLPPRSAQRRRTAAVDHQHPPLPGSSARRTAGHAQAVSRAVELGDAAEVAQDRARRRAPRRRGRRSGRLHGPSGVLSRSRGGPRRRRLVAEGRAARLERRLADAEGRRVGRDADDGEELGAGARADRVDDGAAVGVVPGGERRAGLDGRRVAAGDVEAAHVTLELAEVLHARDDLLTGVAALPEAQAVDELEVDHLRHERLARGGDDAREPGGDVAEAPGALAVRPRVRRHGVPGHDDQVAAPRGRLPRSVRRHVVPAAELRAVGPVGAADDLEHVPGHRPRQRRHPVRGRLATVGRARQTEADEIVARGERHVRPHDEHPEPLQQPLDQLPLDDQAQSAVGERQHERQREQPALRVAVARETRPARPGTGQVVAELSLQERHRVGTAGVDDGEVRQTRRAGGRREIDRGEIAHRTEGDQEGGGPRRDGLSQRIRAVTVPLLLFDGFPPPP